MTLDFISSAATFILNTALCFYAASFWMRAKDLANQGKQWESMLWTLYGALLIAVAIQISRI